MRVTAVSSPLSLLTAGSPEYDAEGTTDSSPLPYTIAMLDGWQLTVTGTEGSSPRSTLDCFGYPRGGGLYRRCVDTGELLAAVSSPLPSDVLRGRAILGRGMTVCPLTTGYIAILLVIAASANTEVDTGGCPVHGTWGTKASYGSFGGAFVVHGSNCTLLLTVGRITLFTTLGGGFP